MEAVSSEINETESPLPSDTNIAYETCARFMKQISEQMITITSKQDKISEQLIGIQEQVLDKISLLTQAHERNDKEFTQVHRDFVEFMRIQDSMQAELEQHRSNLFRQLFDPILSAIAHIYADYIGNVGKIDDPKLRNNMSNMFDDIEQILTENGVEAHISTVGEQVSKRFSRIRDKVSTANKELHGTVIRSHNTGFHIGPRVLVPENVDVYIFDANL
jgi:molecular chaperone GrpE (heat shock protein)